MMTLRDQGFDAALAAELESAALTVTERCREQLAEHYRLLERWSRSVRLVGSLAPEIVIRRHIMESLALVPWIHEPKGALLDIGSGNGYPAIPIQCALPELRVSMMEPTLRKSLFLEEVIHRLGLREAAVIRSRVDRPADLARHGKWDCLTMRAVAAIPLVMQGAPAALRPRGRLLFLVGEAGRREVEAGLEPHFRLQSASRLPGADGSYLVVAQSRL